MHGAVSPLDRDLPTPRLPTRGDAVMAPNAAARVAEVRRAIAAACGRCGRQPDEVTLVGISKTHPAAAVQAVVDAGVTILGESRVQEAAEKVPYLTGIAELHLVGRLQRNKAKAAVALFDVIHSLDRVPLAEALDAVARAAGKVQRVFVQVNIGDEAQKGGVARGGVPELLAAVAALPQLRLEGLMCVPPYARDPEAARPYFRALARLAAEHRPAEGPPLALSMGMSHDFEVAIEEGATHVRVGTALFGER
jgi:pyridoxal phosphate enzyme (YggS family)